MKKLIIFCVITILAAAAGAGGIDQVPNQSSPTNTPPEPFMWASSNYTDKVFKTVVFEEDANNIFSDPTLKGKIVKLVSKHNARPEPRRLCDQVGIANFGPFWGIISGNNYLRYQAYLKSSVRSKTSIFFIYIPDDKLRAQMSIDINDHVPKGWCYSGAPLGIILGITVKTGISKTSYGW